jgi:hypothetical protein
MAAASTAREWEHSMRHTTAARGAALIGFAAVAWASAARAQEEGYLEQAPLAPSNVFELKVGGAYAQGFGHVAPGRRVPDVAGPGATLDVDADYRVAPRVSVGVQAEIQEFASRRNVAARGIAANAGATVHASPAMRGDAWLRAATGYRLLWSVDPPGEPTTLVHGFELAKVTVGYDVRVSPDIALAPVVGAGVDLFVWEVQSGWNTALAAPQLGAFVFAGVQGRFDIGVF